MLGHIVFTVSTTRLETRQNPLYLLIRYQYQITRLSIDSEFLETNVVSRPVLHRTLGPHIYMGVVLDTHLGQTVDKSLLMDSME